MAIITNAFPFYPGEHFLEDEIKYWAESGVDKVLLVPLNQAGEPREVPQKIEVVRIKTARKFFFAVRAVWSPLLFRELWRLHKCRALGFRKLYAAIKCVAAVKMAEVQLDRLVSLHGAIDLAYCYWNDSQSYAACLLKKKGLIGKVVARAHGYDLYKERRLENYMPLKSQFIDFFDRIYVLSEQAYEYYEREYGLPKSIKISRLGVPVRNVKPKIRHAGFVHVISISYCHPVKRIDKIILALKIFSERNPKTRIAWSHIGDGALLEPLKNKAAEELSGLNVEFSFVGQLSNSEVRRFISEENIELIINASESEGIPVSLMEAMSVGIPAIAPSVGGISFLVREDNGFLLSSNPEPAEISVALEKALHDDRLNKKRVNARSWIMQNYNSEKNYKDFVVELESMVGSNEAK